LKVENSIPIDSIGIKVESFAILIQARQSLRLHDRTTA